MKLKYSINKEMVFGMLRLIRLPNLLIIILTQALIRYSIILPLLYGAKSEMSPPLVDFIVLMILTLLLAASGYIINDYFDVKIDRINRPDKMVIPQVITPGKAIGVHLIITGIAVFLGFYLAWRIKSVTFGLLFPFIAGLLWVYSAKYKRVLFWGNFIVALLSAFVTIVVWLFEFFWLGSQPEIFATKIPQLGIVSRIILAYALFAFLVTLIREIVKDMEDYEGDKKYECKTIPVVRGIRFSRYLVLALTLLTMLLLAWGQVILYRLELLMAFWYFAAAVQIPAFYLLIRTFKAVEKQDFHDLSSLCKLLMVAGILSMQILFISQ